MTEETKPSVCEASSKKRKAPVYYTEDMQRKIAAEYFHAIRTNKAAIANKYNLAKNTINRWVRLFKLKAKAAHDFVQPKRKPKRETKHDKDRNSYGQLTFRAGVVKLLALRDEKIIKDEEFIDILTSRAVDLVLAGQKEARKDERAKVLYDQGY